MKYTWEELHEECKQCKYIKEIPQGSKTYGCTDALNGISKYKDIRHVKHEQPCYKFKRSSEGYNYDH